MKKRIYFENCEHSGDLENYKMELTNCGAKILFEEPDYSEETVLFVIEVEDYEVFLQKFRLTDEIDSSNLQ
jgi:hypothetical protein